MKSDKKQTQIDWNDEFANAKYIPNGSSYPKLWKQLADSFRSKWLNKNLDCRYGEHPRQRFDLFLPTGQNVGLVIFVHGGYWLDFDKSFWSHLARGVCENNWTCAIPSYVLAPEAKISEITQMISVVIETCATKISGPIVLIGHSAGGHLVSRMACKTTVLKPKTSARIQRIYSISGIHDLTNLLYTEMNSKLALTRSEVFQESPSKLMPRPNVKVVCWVGAKERPEFLRQADLLFHAWTRALPSIERVVEHNKHHFNVIESLTDPNSILTRTVCGLSALKR